MPSFLPRLHPFFLFPIFFLTFYLRRAIIGEQAGVLELADEEDSKSFGLITRAGSTPATGTMKET